MKILLLIYLMNMLSGLHKQPFFGAPPPSPASYPWVPLGTPGYLWVQGASRTVGLNSVLCGRVGQGKGCMVTLIVSVY